jgi:NtrC-family two-component system sensor histidine kinase KinB
MRIKTKLTLGVGLLFIMIILLSLVGAGYINSLSNDTQNILAANYNSLQYTRNILSAMDEPDKGKTIDLFEKNLSLQQKNITEIGEQELTDNLTKNFHKYKANTADTSVQVLIRKEVYDIMRLNMDAIQRKSKTAEQTSSTATMWIVLTGTCCILIAFSFLINFPGGIANPIRELTASIQEIANKNYNERLNFERGDEFGELADSFNTMAEKLEEYNSSNLAKLMMEKKRIETLINNMHAAVIGLDENKKIIFINDVALKISGLKKEDTIGKTAQDIAVHNDLIRSLIQDLVIGGNESSIEKAPVLKIFADGKESYFEKETLNISIVPTGEKIKQLIGYVIVLRNVTGYKELDVAKTNFIATVSHEFKTPISSIKMSLQLLENEQTGTLNEEQKNLLGSIHQDADRLLKITGELLNMTQVESGNIQLSIVPSDPKEILTYAINATRTQADQKQIKFEVSIPDNLPRVQADSEKTAWVLTNIISNAIRYSYDNSTIYLSIIAENKKVRFSVKDTGQGIDPQYKEKIFDRYFRIPGTKKEGTGLGLAISKEFIEAQGGQINVKSEFGAGSTFTITLNGLT